MKKGVCILLAGTIIGSFVGCSKNKDEAVSINIIDNTFESNDEFTYIFNPEFIAMNDALRTIFVDGNIDLLRETKNTYYTSDLSMEGANITNLMTKGTFNSFYSNLVLPDCYGYVSPTSYLLNTSLRYKDFVGFNNNDEYQYVEAKLVVKKDIIRPDVPGKILRKGDEMSSRAFYVKRGNEVYLLAYEQTGVGSDCENVKDKTCGNIDDLLISLEIMMDADRNITTSEAIDFVNNYDNGTVKVLKK